MDAANENLPKIRCNRKYLDFEANFSLFAGRVEDLFSSVSKQERIQEIYNRSKIHFSRDLKGEIIALPPDSCCDTLAQISSSKIHKSTGFLLFNDAFLQTLSDYKLCLQIYIYTRNSNVFLKHAFQRNLTLIIPIFFRSQ